MGNNGTQLSKASSKPCQLIKPKEQQQQKPIQKTKKKQKKTDDIK